MEEQKNQLHEAYVKAYAEMQNVTKNAANSFFGSDYATLDAVLDAVRPVFAKHSLAVMQVPGKVSELAGTLVVSVVNVIKHSSGQQLVIESQSPIAPQTNKKTGEKEYTPQAVGSAITYLRRYALAAIAGIAQTDDDGNAGSARPVKSGGDLMAKVAAATEVGQRGSTTDGELESLREEIVASGDQSLADAFAKRKTELTKGKKK